MDESPPSPDIDPRERLRERRGHAVALGIAYSGHGGDWCELTMPYDRRLISDLSTGILASGPIVSLIEVAATAAVALRQDRPPYATLDLRVDYLRPSYPGRTVTARAECYRLTRRIGFARGIAHDGDAGDPLAHFAATFMLEKAA